MDIANIRKSFVRENYNREAERYRTSSDVQQLTLSILFSLVKDHLADLQPRRVADIGCGLGVAIKAMQDVGLSEDISYIGIDLSPKMIALAKEIYRQDGIGFQVGDAEALDLPDQSIDLVIASAMIHWLNQPKLGNTPARALSEMNRVLRPQGLAILATPAIEAFHYRQAYHRVVSRHADQPYFTDQLYCEDPLGTMSLFDLIGFAQAASFKIEVGATFYHTYEFPSVAVYADSVRAYGYNAYMAPFDPELRETVWAEIADEFRQMMGSGIYTHEIYSNYLALRKP